MYVVIAGNLCDGGTKGQGSPAVDELIWWPNLLMFPWLLNGHNNEERSERHLVSPVIFLIVFDLLVSNGFFRRLLFLIPYTFLLRSDTKYHSHNFISWYTGNVRFHAFIPTIMHRFWDNLFKCMFYNICTIWWGVKLLLLEKTAMHVSVIITILQCSILSAYTSMFEGFILFGQLFWTGQSPEMTIHVLLMW